MKHEIRERDYDCNSISMYIDTHDGPVPWTTEQMLKSRLEQHRLENTRLWNKIKRLERKYGI